MAPKIMFESEKERKRESKKVRYKLERKKKS